MAGGGFEGFRRLAEGPTMNAILEELNDHARATAEGYRPLPQPPARESGEPAVSYGARILAFLLETSCTATVDDAGLELAEHTAMIVVSAREISELAIARISDVRHLIASALKARKVPSVDPVGVAVAPSAQNLGPMAPLAPPVPSLPPAGERVSINF